MVVCFLILHMIMLHSWRHYQFYSLAIHTFQVNDNQYQQNDGSDENNHPNDSRDHDSSNDSTRKCIWIGRGSKRHVKEL